MYNDVVSFICTTVLDLNLGQGENYYTCGTSSKRKVQPKVQLKVACIQQSCIQQEVPDDCCSASPSYQ